MFDYRLLLFPLFFGSTLFASPSDSEILRTIKEYLILNDPNILDDLLPDERRERTEKFNNDFREFSETLGKKEVFYYIKLARSDNLTSHVKPHAILHVPYKYLQHFESLTGDERRLIGEFIWEQKLEGNLRLRHLRKVNIPPVAKFLQEQYEIEGGPGTGRGYQIKKILDELAALNKSAEYSSEISPDQDGTNNPVKSPEDPKNQPDE